MKILLINSPLLEEAQESVIFDLPPFGLAYIATQLEYSGYQVILVDSINENLGIDDILNKINKYKPQFIGLNIFSVNINIVKKIVKGITIDTNIVIGGKVVEHIFSDVLQWHTKNNIICIVGEGEIIWPAIVKGELKEKYYNGNKKRQIYRVDYDSPFYPKDLDNIPLERRYIKTYNGDRKEEYIITSRGCIYDCAFCGGAVSYNTGGKVRSRSIQNIKNEIIEIYNSNNELESIRILDDLFLKSRNNIKVAIDLFNYFPQLSWRAMAHIIPLLNNMDMLIELKKSGCNELFLGIESGSDKIRDFIKKEGSKEDIIFVVNEIFKVGINVKAYFIFGFPDETEQDMIQTFELAKKLKGFSKENKVTFRTSVFQYKPYHGTELYDYLIKCGCTIPDYEINNNIEGNKRQGYNHVAGNFSNCDTNLISFFINSTLEINNE